MSYGKTGNVDGGSSDGGRSVGGRASGSDGTSAAGQRRHGEAGADPAEIERCATGGGNPRQVRQIQDRRGQVYGTRTGRSGHDRRQDRRLAAQGGGHADVQNGRGGGRKQSREGQG